MKDKAIAKVMARSRKPLKKWPRFFKDMLDQLDIAGDNPVFLSKSEIAPEFRSYIPGLMVQRLLSEETTNAIACISCNAMAAVRRTGAKGEKASILCPCCGAIFQANAKELRQWRTDGNSLGMWIKDMAGVNGEMEAISPMVLFLGHLTNRQERFEVYLARFLIDQASAQQSYACISQAMSGSGIVLSLAENFLKTINPKIVVASLADCIALAGAEFEFAWPEHVFAGKNPAKQRAGLTRAQNDPRLKQKAKLKVFVRQNITGVFADRYHHDTAKEIVEKHAVQIIYEDSNGKERQLSKDMILEVIKEVLRENGLEEWISGKQFKL